MKRQREALSFMEQAAIAFATAVVDTNPDGSFLDVRCAAERAANLAAACCATFGHGLDWEEDEEEDPNDKHEYKYCPRCDEYVKFAKPK